MIRMTALINIKTFLGKFKQPEHIEGYVKLGLIYYGEIPFLYHVFKSLAVHSLKERGGYKVVSLFSPLVTKKLSTNFLSDSPGGVPKPSDPRYHVGVLWKMRYQGVSPNDFVTGKKSCGGTCTHLHRSTYSRTTS